MRHAIPARLARLVSRARDGPARVEGPPPADLGAAHALWGCVPAFNYVRPEWFEARRETY